MKLLYRLMFALCFLAGAIPLFSSFASQHWRGPANPRQILEAIAESSTGRELLHLAQKQLLTQSFSYSDLAQFLYWGEVSKTDSVLTRRLDPHSGAEIRERKISIFLKRDQDYEALLLDLVHELSHAAVQPQYDPYDPNLTAAQYIRASIEGKGGEAKAVELECRVAQELKFSSLQSRCGRYLSKGRVLPELILQDFYYVGHWKKQIVAQLGKDATRFPLLSGEAPQLFSSTGNAPYPAALLSEFRVLNQVACQNSYRRLASIGRGSESQESDRNKMSGQRNRQTLEFLKKRCGHEVPSLRREHTNVPNSRTYSSRKSR